MERHASWPVYVAAISSGDAEATKAAMALGFPSQEATDVDVDSLWAAAFAPLFAASSSPLSKIHLASLLYRLTTTRSPNNATERIYNHVVAGTRAAVESEQARRAMADGDDVFELASREAFNKRREVTVKVFKYLSETYCQHFDVKTVPMLFVLEGE